MTLLTGICMIGDRDAEQLIEPLASLDQRLPFWHVAICGNNEPADTQGMRCFLMNDSCHNCVDTNCVDTNCVDTRMNELYHACRGVISLVRCHSYE